MLLSRKMEPFPNIWIILPNSIFVLCENFEKFSLDFFYLEGSQTNILDERESIYSRNYHTSTENDFTNNPFYSLIHDRCDMFLFSHPLEQFSISKRKSQNALPSPVNKTVDYFLSENINSFQLHQHG